LKQVKIDPHCQRQNYSPGSVDFSTAYRSCTNSQGE